jgi:hypothetical protein
MRCVSSEHELEQHSRALTVDGMLSANFSTSRLRLYPPEDLMFGKKVTDLEKIRLHQELRDAMTAESDANGLVSLLSSIINEVTSIGSRDDVLSRLSNAVQEALTQ